jgi:hypothetical protein
LEPSDVQLVRLRFLSFFPWRKYNFIATKSYITFSLIQSGR